MKHCTVCGDPFSPKRDYYHECPKCWHPARYAGPSQRTHGAEYLAGYGDGLARGRDVGHEAGYRAGYSEGMRAASAYPPRTNSGIAPDLIMEIVRLCHPDRHPPERFDQANRVTAQVLALRDVAGVWR